MFNSLFKAVLGVVAVPVAVVADVVEVVVDPSKTGSYTALELGQMLQNLQDATNPNKD